MYEVTIKCPGWHRYCGDRKLKADFSVSDLTDQRDERLRVIAAMIHRRCSVKTAPSYNTRTPNEA